MKKYKMMDDENITNRYIIQIKEVKNVFKSNFIKQIMKIASNHELKVICIY